MKRKPTKRDMTKCDLTETDMTDSDMTRRGTTGSAPTSSPDLIDQLVPLPVGAPLHAVRHQRAKVVDATRGSYDALFDPALAGPSLAERLLAAQAIARLAGSADLEAHYRERLQALEGPATDENDARTAEILRFTRTLAERPVDGDRAALLRLPAAGLDTPAVIALAQLIAFVSYQLRVVAGLRALSTAGAFGEAVGSDTVAEASPAPASVTPAAPAPAAPGNPTSPASSSPAPSPPTPFIHPADLPPVGEPLRINGYTSESLEWQAWLPVLDLAQATPEQIAVLEASHPKAKTSDYYRLLVHQPRILQERSTVFNAIMYAPGGLPRAERELASAVVSRVNGCVYCASVHAQRFEQLTKRNDVIAQVFAEPQGAGTTARERAIVQAAIDLTRSPAGFGPAQVRPLHAAGLSAPEIVDLVHAIAIFAWANRLMLNLGEPVFPEPR